MSETWRLDRLVLQGFKSFADRTLLDFPDPVTGIIGPNGSGKSNLVEAIRFVTGSRAQDLRGEELKALLFHGAKTRPPRAWPRCAWSSPGAGSAWWWSGALRGTEASSG